MRNVLLVFPSILLKTTKEKLVKNISHKLLDKKIRIFSLKNENNFIVLDVNDLVEARSTLIAMFGIDKVAVARRTDNDFSKVVNAICAVGQEVIMPNEKFFVKVKLHTGGLRLLDYKERDVEFVSSGLLASELSSRPARPARSIDMAHRTIQSYIDKDHAYICIETSPSPGGMPFDSQYHKVACSIHSLPSVLSCLASMRSGFLPEIFLPYSNEEDLRNKLKLSEPVVNKIDKRKFRISIAPVVIPSSLRGSIEVLVLESIYCNILALLSGDIVLVPLSTAYFPTWYVNSVINDVISAGKIPWTPLIFKCPVINDSNAGLNFYNKSSPLHPTTNRALYFKHRQMINNVSRSAITALKTISFKIGSNYVHDIIDAI